MTVGTLLIFMDYTRKLWDPLKWLTEFVAKVAFHAAASRRVFTVLEHLPHGRRQDRRARHARRASPPGRMWRAPAPAA
jgi:ABC-type multidrug transport system fused ATPase/permease subunit